MQTFFSSILDKVLYESPKISMEILIDAFRLKCVCACTCVCTCMCVWGWFSISINTSNVKCYVYTPCILITIKKMRRDSCFVFTYVSFLLHTKGSQVGTVPCVTYNRRPSLRSVNLSPLSKSCDRSIKIEFDIELNLWFVNSRTEKEPNWKKITVIFRYVYLFNKRFTS